MDLLLARIICILGSALNWQKMKPKQKAYFRSSRLKNKVHDGAKIAVSFGKNGGTIFHWIS